MKKLKVFYYRVSTSEQSTSRQLTDTAYDLLLEDTCSGVTPLFSRPSGERLKKLIDKGMIASISVHHPDRMFRNMLDFFQTINFLNEKKINVHFVSIGLMTLQDDGQENPISKLVLSMLSIISEMERTTIKTRVKEGIAIAKLNGSYLGRKKGTKEDLLKFLSKPKNSKIADYIRRGYKTGEIMKLTEASPNTIIKVKKCLQNY